MKSVKIAHLNVKNLPLIDFFAVHRKVYNKNRGFKLLARLVLISVVMNPKAFGIGEINKGELLEKSKMIFSWWFHLIYRCELAQRYLVKKMEFFLTIQ